MKIVRLIILFSLHCHSQNKISFKYDTRREFRLTSLKKENSFPENNSLLSIDNIARHETFLSVLDIAEINERPVQPVAKFQEKTAERREM